MLLLLRVVSAVFFIYNAHQAYITGGVMPMASEWMNAAINIFTVLSLLDQLRGRTATADKTGSNPNPL